MKKGFLAGVLAAGLCAMALFAGGSTQSSNAEAAYNAGDQEALKALVGIWEGSYRAGQGETGLTLTIYEDGGVYKAIFDFYNLPGRNNALNGKYYMNAAYSAATKKYSLKGYEWIERPGNYGYVDLEGTLAGNVFTGNVFSSSTYDFKVSRIDQAVQEKREAEADALAQAIAQASTGGTGSGGAGGTTGGVRGGSSSDGDSARTRWPQIDTDASATAWTVNNTATWVQAVGGIRNAGNNKTHVIDVTGDISIPMSADPTFGAATGITVTLQGSGSISTSSVGALLFIGKGQTVAVKDLALKGRADNNTHVVNNNGGTFLLTGSASITGNGDKASGVRVGGGFFGMTDNASVSDNKFNGVDVTGGTIILAGGAVVSGSQGAGIHFLEGDPTLIMRNSASVSGNSGAGIHSASRYGSGDIYMYDTSSVQGNGNVGILTDGTLAMSDNTVVANNFRGVYVSSGTFTMRNYAQVAGNAYKASRGGAQGGGVYLDEGNMVMYDNSSITENTVATEDSDEEARGGGVYVGYESTLTMRDESSISGNAAEYGGGVFIGTSSDDRFSHYGNLIMEGGSISNNTASKGGGGVRVSDGNFTKKNGSIKGNSAIWGGGVYFSFTMENGVISGNTAEYGGGVYLNGTLLTKTGGTIGGNDDPANANTATNSGHALYDAKAKNWRNAGAGPDMNDDSYGFWLND